LVNFHREGGESGSQIFFINICASWIVGRMVRGIKYQDFVVSPFLMAVEAVFSLAGFVA